ncbi:MAG: DUF4091 domain-containing protein [Planctomycetes bacterium]|nr:DUF4091 domain-containing protein [Planctomycetota bacterium]
MGKAKKLAVAAVVGANACLAAARGGTLAAWAADPHVKVFRDAPAPGEPGMVRLRAARNEFEPGQIAFRSTAPLKGVRVELSPLRHADGAATIGGDSLAWHFVGFIPLKKNTPDSGKVQLRAAPCGVPDPLLDARSLDVAAESTQPVWLTVRVPKDAKPGVYRGEVAIVAGDARAAVPVELTVDPFALPDARHLLVTNWFNLDNIAKAHKAQAWSEGFWPVLERYARDMAAHRQNVALTPWSLVQITREVDGKLSFDYGRFDRYVELFQKAGVSDGIELTHVGHFGPGGWGGKEIVLVKVGAADRKTGKRVELGPEEGLAPLLADLEKHLAAKGWLAKAMIHVADEPSLNNLASWRKASEFVHKAAPGIRRIDAIESVDFTGALEVWVPKLSHFERWRDAYEARRKGNEFWFYICCHPVGNYYPNRFLDFPLSRVRVLHWLNFACDLTGYLHWGLNFWGEDPFGPPSDNLPPGDTHVVYPGADGPLDSIRWEIQRESIEDFEYLWLLAAKTAEAKKRLGSAADWVDPRRRAVELCRQVVPAIADTEKDPARIMAVRGEIADEIIALDAEPQLLVETEPMAGATLVHGPISVELRGVTRPGATVKLNGSPVAVGPDGSFASHVSPRGTRHEVRIEAEQGGSRKLATRLFHVRR